MFSVEAPGRWLFGRRPRRRIIVLDVFGRQKISITHGEIFCGIASDMAAYLETRLKSIEIAPRIRLISGLKAMDFSGLTSKKDVIYAVRCDADLDGAILLDLS